MCCIFIVKRVICGNYNNKHTNDILYAYILFSMKGVV